MRSPRLHNSDARLQVSHSKAATMATSGKVCVLLLKRIDFYE
jgi:hypothetical protein